VLELNFFDKAVVFEIRDMPSRDVLEVTLQGSILPKYYANLTDRRLNVWLEQHFELPEHISDEDDVSSFKKVSAPSNTKIRNEQLIFPPESQLELDDPTGVREYDRCCTRVDVFDSFSTRKLPNWVYTYDIFFYLNANKIIILKFKYQLWRPAVCTNGNQCKCESPRRHWLRCLAYR
jgi:hypothetical protein